MKIFILILFVSLLVGACSSSKKTVDVSDKTQNDVAAHDESFDPLSLNDNDVVIQKKEKQKAIIFRKDIPIENDTEKEAKNLEAVIVDGYRIQILATKSIESATMVRQTSADQFRSMKHESYLVFESPQYKVRIGDVTTRSEAEEIRDMAKDYGYKGAFIVRSKVKVYEQK